MTEQANNETVAAAAPSNLRWYVVHAYSGMEKAVERNLRERIERSGMQDKFGRILVPTEEVVELKGGKLRGLRKAATNEATDARITAKSDDLVALIDGRLGVAYAFLTGKVKVDAPASDLMMLRKLF